MLRKRSLMYPLFGVCMFLTQANPIENMYGSVALHDVSVSNEVKIIGVGEIKDSVLDKDVRVVGCLKSRNSQYLADIYTVGSSLSLRDDLVAGDVHITNYVKPPKVYMTNSNIKGRVIFHGLKSGKVIKDAESTIGGVENGEVE